MVWYYKIFYRRGFEDPIPTCNVIKRKKDRAQMLKISCKVHFCIEMPTVGQGSGWKLVGKKYKYRGRSVTHLGLVVSYRENVKFQATKSPKPKNIG